MRIALLGAYPVLPFAQELGIKNSPKNTTSWNVNLARALARISGNEVHFLTINSKLRRRKVLFSEGVYLHFLDCPPKIRFFTLFQYNKMKIHKELSKLDPDIVHGHGTEHEYPYIAVSSRYPSVITIHCILRDIINHINLSSFNHFWFKFLQLLEKYTLSKARYVIGTTEYMRDKIKLNGAKYFTIPNSVNPIYFTYTPCIYSKQKKFLFVGRISPEKGIEYLLQAIAHINEKNNNIQLLIIGRVEDKNYYQELKQKVTHYNISENVNFYGMANPTEIASLLSTSTGLILPSKYDAFGLVLVEAMAVGIPVIGTRVGGIPHIVRDGETGFLVEPGNVEELAEKMLLLLKNHDLRKSMGKEGKEDALHRFHPDVVAQKTMAVYEEVLRNWTT